MGRGRADEQCLRRRGRFPAINLLAAAGPRVRLEYTVRMPHESDVASATCAALVDAVGAGRVLQGESGRKAEAAGFFDSLYASVAVSPLVVIEAGRRMLASGLVVAATSSLARVATADADRPTLVFVGHEL